MCLSTNTSWAADIRHLCNKTFGQTFQRKYVPLWFRSKDNNTKQKYERSHKWFVPWIRAIMLTLVHFFVCCLTLIFVVLLAHYWCCCLMYSCQLEFQPKVPNCVSAKHLPQLKYFWQHDSSVSFVFGCCFTELLTTVNNTVGVFRPAFSSFVLLFMTFKKRCVSERLHPSVVHGK